MRILHFADLHLDRPLVGLAPDVGRRRRQELRAALRRCLAAAREHNVDVVTIGGDLWEEEHVPPDTRRFVVSELNDLNLVGCNNSVTPPGRTGEPHHRDGRDAGHEPCPAPSPMRTAGVSREAA